MGRILSRMFPLFMVLVTTVLTQNLTSGFRSSNFFLPPVKESWHNGVEYCHQLKMRMAVLDSAAKQKELAQLIKDFHIETAFWIGASDLGKTDRYRWHETGVELKNTYTNWAPREPSNRNEHCVEMNPKWNGGQWNDVDCGRELFFACEKTSTC